MTGTPRRLHLGTIVILVLTACALPYYLWTAATEFMAHPFYGLNFSRQSGEVWLAYPGQEGEAAGIVRGDRVLDIPRGNVLQGLELAERHTDPLRVSTAHGIVTLHPDPLDRTVSAGAWADRPLRTIRRLGGQHSTDCVRVAIPRR